jgi:hypothetical protein
VQQRHLDVDSVDTMVVAGGTMVVAAGDRMAAHYADNMDVAGMVQRTADAADTVGMMSAADKMGVDKTGAAADYLGGRMHN